MLSIKMNPFSFLVLTTLVLATFLVLQSSAVVENDVVFGIESLEGSNGSGVNSSNGLVLAKERTRRKDPTDDLKYYTGGWDIKNAHYLASVLYTGSTLFLVAGLWFVGFGIFLLLVSFYFCCCHKRRYGYSKVAYALSVILLSLFTIAAIIGSVVLYTGEGEFKDSTKSTLDYIVKQADDTVTQMNNVSNYLTAAKSVGVDQTFLPRDVQNNIDRVNTLISTAANTLGSATNDNKDYIYQILDTVGLILIVVAAVMLALALLGFLLSICGLQCIVYILVILGWILVAVTFILCGIFLVLHNAVGDTCFAMNEWVVNPTAHTTLSDIIPCVDLATSQEAQNQSKEVTFQTAQLVNSIITNISNLNISNLPIQPPFSYNQSGPLVPNLCNPYNSDMTDRTCVTGEVDLSNATQVWRNYECQASNEVCTSVGRLTPSMFGNISGVVNVSYGLYQFGPFLAKLTDCTFVRDTFTTIHEQHCPDLRKYTRLVYIGLAMVSIAVMLSLILWVLYARERRHRKYTKLVDATSGPSGTKGTDQNALAGENVLTAVELGGTDPNSTILIPDHSNPDDVMQEE